MIKKGLIIGDGSMKVDTSAFGVYVTDAGVYPPTSRNYNMVHISGRNGDLSIDGNDFSNGTLRFPACMLMDGIESANSADYIAFKGALNRMTGYQKIVDPFLANYYRMGIFTNNSEPKWSADKSLWVFDLKFNAKPQLFLNEGDTVKSFTANSTLKNPTGYITRPLLRIYGKGTVGIGDYSIIVNTAGNSYIDFDCETMDAYEGTNDRNSYITAPHQPYLNETSTGITLGTGITRVDITPRWYTIV